MPFSLAATAVLEPCKNSVLVWHDITIPWTDPADRNPSMTWCADGLFRATTAKWILARRGDIFMQDVPVCIFESSSLVEHVDVFVSHSWRSAHWAKVSGAVPLLESDSSCRVLRDNVGSGYRSHDRRRTRGTANLGGNLLLPPIVLHLPIVVFLAVFLFGQHAVHSLRPMSMWVDRACIHQTDLDFKHRQIQALPVFVSRSSSMLVLWDDECFRRLWCQLELATFASTVELRRWISCRCG